MKRNRLGQFARTRRNPPLKRGERFRIVLAKIKHARYKGDREGPQAAMWLNLGTLADAAKARTYAAENGYTVFLYPKWEDDPLGRAKREIVARGNPRRTRTRSNPRLARDDIPTIDRWATPKPGVWEFRVSPHSYFTISRFGGGYDLHYRWKWALQGIGRYRSLSAATSAARSAWREQRPVPRANPHPLVYGTPRLGAMLHHWHSGQGDPVYGVGSLWYAGKGAHYSQVEGALRNLRKDLHAMRRRVRPTAEDRKARRELDYLIRKLETVLE